MSDPGFSKVSSRYREEMKKRGYLWWRARLTHMAQYFHAYRIDHILGFFRIWELPGSCTTGLLGHFRPSVPATRAGLEARGLWDIDRLSCLGAFGGAWLRSVWRGFCHLLKNVQGLLWEPRPLERASFIGMLIVETQQAGKARVTTPWPQIPVCVFVFPLSSKLCRAANLLRVCIGDSFVTLGKNITAPQRRDLDLGKHTRRCRTPPKCCHLSCVVI